MLSIAHTLKLPFSVYKMHQLSLLIFATAVSYVCKVFMNLTPGVNFTNILGAAFAPKSFWQKITNPNCKHLKAVQRTLVWLSISPIFYKQLFQTKVVSTPFMCLQFGFVIFWQEDFGAKAAHKMLVTLTPGVNVTNILWAAFSYESFCAAFMCLQFGFAIFWWKELGSKASH